MQIFGAVSGPLREAGAKGLSFVGRGEAGGCAPRGWQLRGCVGAAVGHVGDSGARGVPARPRPHSGPSARGAARRCDGAVKHPRGVPRAVPGLLRYVHHLPRGSRNLAEKMLA